MTGPDPAPKQSQRIRRDPAHTFAQERRSQLRGLLYLAAAILLFALLRAHWHR